MNKQKCFLGRNSTIGEDCHFGFNCIVEDSVSIGNNVFIDNNVVLRSGSVVEDNCFIGANCIIGEYQMDFVLNRDGSVYHQTHIGANSIIRSGTIIYSDNNIGENFQAGHNVTIREKTTIGNNVSIGTLSDIQGHCTIGNYVRLHSNVHIGMSSVIDDCCWIYPYVVLTNDPTPPSDTEIGVHVHSFAIIATGSVILPGIDIASDSLVAAGSLVNRDVKNFQVVAGNPAKEICDIRKIKNRETGKEYYPWRYHFDRNMPWKGYGFDEWAESLTLEEKECLFHGIVR